MTRLEQFDDNVDRLRGKINKQQAEIAALKTEVEQWKVRELLHQADNGRLRDEIARLGKIETASRVFAATMCQLLAEDVRQFRQKEPEVKP